MRARLASLFTGSALRRPGTKGTVEYFWCQVLLVLRYILRSLPYKVRQLEDLGVVMLLLGVKPTRLQGSQLILRHLEVVLERHPLVFCHRGQVAIHDPVDRFAIIAESEVLEGASPPVPSVDGLQEAGLTGSYRQRHRRCRRQRRHFLHLLRKHAQVDELPRNALDVSHHAYREVRPLRQRRSGCARPRHRRGRWGCHRTGGHRRWY
mmetsp:Transcript_38745/g.89282  ORF Transcript_38745/g.89282 Transcript_38745/m.89282 type:complete len:207 (-) Transcript_38745:3-623(-)